jgi:hypothetical protein
MQIRQLPLRWRGRGVAPADRGQAPADGPGRGEPDGAAWGDERQVAVWGQVSARTLYLVVMLNVAAGFIFNIIDSRRYAPCVTVFYAIALGCTAYAGWTARRKGVDVRAPYEGRAQMVAQCLTFGVLFYLVNRFLLGDHQDSSWPAATADIVGYAVGFGIAMRFFAAWRRRQELRSLADTDDDTPDPMP